MIPAARAALTDRRLRGAPREVYFWLYERLDLVTFRQVTLGRIALGTGLRRNTVHRAVQTLVELQYLDRRAGEARARLYRLMHSPAT